MTAAHGSARPDPTWRRERRGRHSQVRATIATAALVVAALGGSASPSGASTGHHPRAGVGVAAAFAWLRPRPAPPSWTREATPEHTLVLAYPPTFQPIAGDPSTVSAAVRTRGGSYLAYLNVTPRQGNETLADFADFRVEHLRDDEDTQVEMERADSNVPFMGAHGSCVIDTYVTKVRHNHYREIACLVVGARRTAVVVAAASDGAWSRYLPTLRHAVESFDVSAS